MKEEYCSICGSRVYQIPPHPEETVRLPTPFKLPEGITVFEGWGYHPVNCDTWRYKTNWTGHSDWYYAVRPDTDIAYLNGVGGYTKAPLELSDWIGGPWSIRQKSYPLAVHLVVGIKSDDGTYRIKYAGSYAHPKFLMTDCERARGWPTDTGLIWERCWKYVPEKGDIYG